MQRIAIFGALLLVPFLVACGKFADKFSRINGDYTRVHFSDRGRNALEEAATVDGGVMIYFISTASSDVGHGFGFTTKEIASNASVVLPNGQYMVYAYGWDGPSGFSGQSRCGKGAGGSVITLSGASTTITLNLDPNNCGFNTANDFGVAYQGTTSSNDFDAMDIAFCAGATYPSCTSSSSGTWYMKAELLGGIKQGAGSFTEVSPNTLSVCSTASGSGSIVSGLKLPIGGNAFSPPLRLSFFNNASCTGTASGTYLFADGIKQYLSVASGASYYVDIASSSNTYTLKVNRYF